MKVKIKIDLEHNGMIDTDSLCDNLKEFIENDEQTYMDKGEIAVCSLCGTTYDVIGD